MNTAHAIPELDSKGLRHFGLTTGTMVAVLFGLALPWLFDLDYPLWPWLAAAALIVWALAAPASLNGVYLAWMRFGLLLNRIVSPVVLGLVFLLVITPVGLIMRLFGHDPMAQGTESQQASFRVPSKVRDPKHLERPY